MSSTPLPSSPYVEFETETPFQKGVVFSGIAIPDWDLRDDHLQHQTYTINLGYKVLAVLESTVSLGLASIYTGGGNCLFATDSATLCIDTDTQELNLQVNLGLMGNPANLSRFGYQVVVKATVQETSISGTIRFTSGDVGPLNPDLADLQPLLVVTANTFVPVPGGGFGGGGSPWHTLVTGSLTSVSMNGPGVTVGFNIPNVPYNQDLYVHVDLATPAPEVGFSQDAGPEKVNIQVQQPDVSGLDFIFYHARPIE